MLKLQPFIAVFFLCSAFLGWSQQNSSYDFETQLMGRYLAQDFGIANIALEGRTDFADQSSTQEHFALLETKAKLRLNQSGSEKLLQQFQINFPLNPQVDRVNFDLANYYFDQQKYSYALKWYGTVKAADVPRRDVPKYNFNKGYTYFATKKYKAAKPYLERVVDHPAYESDAHYYLGHIAYQLDDFDSATTAFGKSNKKKQGDVAYFQVDMNFRLGRFQEAIRLGEQQYRNAKGDDKSQLSKIIGESYFNLNQYSEALPYLEAYEGKRKRWTNEDFYQLGYAYFQAQDYEKAIGQFNKILGKNTALIQHAYYHLGLCYLKTDKKTEALNAFRSASQKSSDEAIQRAAMLNYARLTYAIGNPYETPPKVLQNFLEKYPKDPATDEIEALLVDSLTSSGNFEAAYNLLQNSGNIKEDNTLQKLAFLIGVEKYSNAKYPQANEYFEAAIKHKGDAFVFLSQYWNGHAYYEQRQYAKAQKAWEAAQKSSVGTAQEEARELPYHLGYAQFKLKAYEEALTAFESFLKTVSPADSKRRDAQLRLADSHYALRAFWPALEAYNSAIAMAPKRSSYAYYQKAMSYGFVDRKAQKISTLKRLLEQYPKVPLRDDAIFELANTLAAEDQPVEALQTFDLLISEQIQSPYRTRAYLAKALLLYNRDQAKEALLTLRALVDQYPKDVVVAEAVRLAKEIAVDIGEVNQFTVWVRSLEVPTMSDAELEKTAFQALDKTFQEGKSKAAQKSIQEYLAQYPEGIYRRNVVFYQGELYFESENWKDALIAYREVYEAGINEFSEKSLVRASVCARSLGQTKELIKILERLEQEADFEENKQYAAVNLMQSYASDQQFEKAFDKAQSLLNDPNLDPQIYWDAQQLIAEAGTVLGKTEAVKKAYARLVESPSAQRAAGALLWQAQQLRTQKQFEDSNAKIALIAQKYASESLIGGQALLVMAQNFLDLGDAFQADFIVKSVLENYASTPEISDRALKLQVQVTQRLGEENASVESLENPSNEN